MASWTRSLRSSETNVTLCREGVRAPEPIRSFRLSSFTVSITSFYSARITTKWWMICRRPILRNVCGRSSGRSLGRYVTRSGAGTSQGAVRRWRNPYRRTFVGSAEFFRSKTPRNASPILDFSRTLYGRAPHVESLRNFLVSTDESICIFSGRGGVGKSKLLHDWCAGLEGWSVVFLKDKPGWDAERVREVPSGQLVIVVDDAHRASLLPQVLQLLAERRQYQPSKLVLSTRPGGFLEAREADLSNIRLIGGSASS